jgi:anthranilate synthase component 1
LYQYVIVFDHYKDELFICQNLLANEQADTSLIESLIRNKDVPQFPFTPVGDERSNITDEAYKAMVEKGIQHCLRGDVFQIVLSRRFEQSFKGDEFNVYRALRSVNPSPYLFFFDYGDYKLMGSSPEAQLIVRNNKAVMHPIAGTFKRTGNDEEDKALSVKLLEDAKENAEHVMLVDLARNDLSRSCTAVTVSQFKQVKFYSHVIHLVSEVVGTLGDAANPFNVLAQTFPAGTLSGAPKFKALEIIDGLEPTARGYYGGAIGFVGFNGDFNHAIMIRSFLSKDNTLYYQAGAGVVVSSNPESELQEVNNKLNALKKAVVLAAGI